jgi:hypothetical protein
MSVATQPVSASDYRRGALLVSELKVLGNRDCFRHIFIASGSFDIKHREEASQRGLDEQQRLLFVMNIHALPLENRRRCLHSIVERYLNRRLTSRAFGNLNAHQQPILKFCSTLVPH